MAFNMVRSGTGLLLGVASGVVNPSIVTPLQISATAGPNGGPLSIGVDAIVEVVGLVGGGLLQFVSPMTLPNLADGLVDGGLALVGRRVSEYVTNAVSGKPQAVFARPAPLPYRANAAMYGGVHNATAAARGVQSSFSTDLPRQRVS